MKRNLSLLLTLIVATSTWAQGFSKQSYYSSATGKKGAALKTELCNIINPHTTISYAGLLDVYHTTDVTPEGYIWDMYSNITRYTPGGPQENHSYNKEGDSYNREHSVPQSWFNERSPMKSDVYHVIPTDGYVNNRRSNYDFGEVGSVSWQSNGGFSKLGSPTSELKKDGCPDDKVFEPNDIYKGDFARIYFYMATCYQNDLSSWGKNNIFASNKYPSFTSWAQKMLLRWARQDHVSQKETDRVEAAYKEQRNRNPFVDFPGLEEYIWGAWQDSIFSAVAYHSPYGEELNDGGDDDDNEGGDDDNVDPILPPDAPEGDYVLVQKNLEDWTGTYVIAYTSEEKNCIFDGGLTEMDAANNVVDITFDAKGNITSSGKVDAACFRIAKTGQKDVYAIQAASGLFIGKSSSKNGLETDKEYDTTLGNTLSVSSDGFVTIKSKCGYVLRYNNAASSGNRFRYYKDGGQQPIRLYRKAEPTGDDADSVKKVGRMPRRTIIYDMQGRKVTSPAPGLYIEGTRKVLRQ